MDVEVLSAVAGPVGPGLRAPSRPEPTGAIAELPPDPWEGVESPGRGLDAATAAWLFESVSSTAEMVFDDDGDGRVVPLAAGGGLVPGPDDGDRLGPDLLFEGRPLAQAVPDARLAAALTGLDVDGLGEFALVETVAAWSRIGSWVSAQMLRAAGVLGDRAGLNPRWPASAGRVSRPDVAGEELAMRLAISGQAGQRLVDLGRALSAELTWTGEELAAGRIDLDKAKVIAKGLDKSPMQTALAVQDAVLDAAPRRTPTELGKDVARALITVDPLEAADREERAVQGRRVCRPKELPDGMAGIWAVLSAVDAVRLDNDLDARARTLRAAGDPRTLDQLRADLLVNTIEATELHDAPVSAALRAASSPSTDDGTSDSHDAQSAGAPGPGPGPGDGAGGGAWSMTVRMPQSLRAARRRVAGRRVRGQVVGRGGAARRRPADGSTAARRLRGRSSDPSMSVAGESASLPEDARRSPAGGASPPTRVGGSPPGADPPGLLETSNTGPSGAGPTGPPGATREAGSPEPESLAAGDTGLPEGRVLPEGTVLPDGAEPSGDTGMPVDVESSVVPLPSTPAPGRARKRARAARTQILVTVPLTTLLGVDDTPGELAGYGPISAETARRLATEGTWRRVVTDPLSGAVLDVGRTRYRPPADLAEHVRVRDRQCARPGCSARAASCDLDHTIEFTRYDGTTAHTNLGPLCPRDHQIKTDGGFTVTQPSPGVFVWRTPTGHLYRIRPGDNGHYEHLRPGRPSSHVDDAPPF